MRRWRQHLLSRPPGAPGDELLRSRDTHTASGFRDFFLNVNEHTTTLADIAAFMAAEGLEFKGFVDPPFEVLSRRFPGERAPGAIARWAAWEAENPNAFLGMYQFWCARRDPTPGSRASAPAG